jgi:exopolysaccharide biosynthesis polyprenyl glycosylphosphotransferase
VIPAAIVRERPRLRPARVVTRGQALHVIGEGIFAGILIRERKRADRSNEPFVVVVIEMVANGRARWRHAIEALAGVQRDTDIVGWFKRERVLAMVLPHTPAATTTGPRALEDAVRAELAKRFDAETLRAIWVGVHVHSPDRTSNVPGAEPVEPLLKACAPRRPMSLTTLGKRALDIVGSALLLLVLAPVLLLIAALIKLTSPGPVFFRQVRVGEHAKPFTMLKFRSMRVDADDRVHREYVRSLIAAGGQGTAATEGVFKMTNDARVTPIGRILRKTSLDELPQFINVLLGSMSLVGPRPPIPYEVEQYKAWHHRRVLDAKPGITGLWQVTGRSRTTFDEMVRLDLRYARTCSLWMDIKILLATPRAVVSGKGAC